VVRGGGERFGAPPVSARPGCKEDDASMRKGIERLLQARGFAIRTFASAEAFLEDTSPTKPDCLVLDIHLGGMSGFDMRRCLLHSHPSLPVIFITAFDDEETHGEALKVGCVAYLRKPFLAKLLMDAIHKATN
jgi:FixJ family two-component response regulator